MDAPDDTTEGQPDEQVPPGSAQGYEMPAGVSPELAERLRAIAPGTPPWVTADDQRQRWELSALTAAGIVLDNGEDLPERDQQIAAWGLARSLYRLDRELPLGSPVADDSEAA